MARSSSKVITKVFLIAVSVFAALARPEYAKVENKPSAAESEKLAAPLPATTVEQVNLQLSSTQQDESLPNVSEDVVDEAFNDMSFMRSQPHKCSNGEGLCDPTGQQIKNLIMSPQTIKYSTDWTAENKTSRRKRMDKLYNLACYYFMPSDYTIEGLYPDEINPDLCTHIIVAAASVQNNSIHFETSYDREILRRVVDLRDQNPELKVLLSILHFSHGSNPDDGFSSVVANKKNLDKFVFNAVSIVNEFYLDGIDINWQFPSWPLLNLDEKYGFAKLLETLRHYLPDSLLTAVVASPTKIIKQSYLIYPLANFVDFINVMAFDHAYHKYSPLTGPNSPLFTADNESPYIQDLNVNSSIQYWISKGMPKEKILLGMPTYGHSYKLENEDINGFDAPTSGPGIGEGSYVTFSELCEFISHQNATTVFELETLTPYTYHEKDWISFDSENSLAFKAEYATSVGLGGAMVYSLNTDDYNGSSKCSLAKFPLTSTIKSVLNKNV